MSSLIDKPVEIISEVYGFTDKSDLHALHESYTVYRDYLSPFIVSSANAMLTDLRQEQLDKPQRTVLFLGRDGTSLGIAVEALDPQFYRNNCASATLSRILVESAIQDLELNANYVFPELESFRGKRNAVKQENTIEAYKDLYKFLSSRNVPANELDSHITVVDSSFKGTVQELMSALYPSTSFDGKYLFFRQARHDPHPHSKRGYILNLDSPTMRHKFSRDALNPDRSLTFLHSDAVAVIEDTLNGALTSPQHFQTGLPQQTLMRYSDDIQGINPSRIAPHYKSPIIREAIKNLGLLTVREVAMEVAQQPDASMAKAALDRQAEQALDIIRNWVEHRHEPAQTAAAEFFTSFVKCNDRDPIADLNSYIINNDVPQTTQQSIWSGFNTLRTRDEKFAYAEQTIHCLEVQSNEKTTISQQIPNQQPPSHIVQDQAVTTTSTDKSDTDMLVPVACNSVSSISTNSALAELLTALEQAANLHSKRNHTRSEDLQTLFEHINRENNAITKPDDTDPTITRE